MKTDACPEREVLGSHLLGKTGGEQANVIDQHLETCDLCLETARELNANDELTEGIRAGKPELQGSESGIDQVIERGKQLGFQTATMETDETIIGKTNAPDASAKSSGTNIDEEINFLAPAEQPDEIGRLGGYRVLNVLGVGGMGVVFRAEDPKLKRQVALKAMKPAVAASKSFKDRFLREAQATASIEHDNIVAIHQVGEDRGIPFIAMPFLQGESLQTCLKREKKLDQRDVLRIGREVAAGLAAAHNRGLIHRDIKPDNIWLEQKTPLPPGEGQLQSRRRLKQGEGGQSTEKQPSPQPSPTGSRSRAKILDFGLVRAANDDAGLTQSGMVLGTPKYMAPEQAQGETVDHRCDLFSLGSVLYRLITGKAPFKGANLTATLMAVVQEDPEAIDSLAPEIDPDFAGLINRLLSKERNQRPQTADEVVKAITNIERRLVTDHPSLAPTERFSAERLLVPVPEEQTDKSARSTSLRRLAQFPRSRFGLLTAVAILLLPLGYFFGGTVIRFVTNQGLLIVEVNDENVEIVIKQNGVVVQDKSTGRAFRLKPVAGEIEVYDKKGNARLLTKKFTLTRGGKAYVTVTHEDLAQARTAKPAHAPESPRAAPREIPPWRLTRKQQAFVDTVAKLEPEQQIEAVRERLKLLNPGYDGKLEDVWIREGRVEDLSFVADYVTDISPVRALPSLEKLGCSGSVRGKGRLADLSPLHGMKLTRLDLTDTQVFDLSPLQGMPLESLAFDRTRVTDLSPVRGMLLTGLSCSFTQVSDLSPLKGMLLTRLSCNGTLVSDLSPLQGMPLMSLNCIRTHVADLSPLQGMPLTLLVHDVRLYHPADETLLESLSKVKVRLGRKLPAEYRKQLAARRKVAEEFVKSTVKLPADEQVEAVRARLSELAAKLPFNAKAPLAVKMTDETVTEAMVNLSQSPYSFPHDLTPLMAFTGLKKLTITGGAYWLDISPLIKLPLESLTCPEPMARKNAPVLAEIKTLKTINGQPAAEFWKLKAAGSR